MTDTHALIRRFFANLGAGTPDPEMFAPEWKAWTVTTHQEMPGAHYLAATQMLATLFGGTLNYEVRALLVDGDRAAAEVHGSGTLTNGAAYANDYAHVFELKDGRITRVAEFFDPAPVTETIMPLLAEAMQKNA